MLIQSAFDLEPILHQKRHYYGTDFLSMTVLRCFHLEHRYFEWQPLNKRNCCIFHSPKQFSNIRSIRIRTFPSSLAIAKMFRWFWQFANFAAKIGGVGLKSMCTSDGAMPCQQSCLCADSLDNILSYCHFFSD